MFLYTYKIEIETTYPNVEELLNSATLIYENLPLYFKVTEVNKTGEVEV